MGETGLWIPPEVKAEKSLSPLEMVLISEIAALGNNGEGCFASNEFLAGKCHCCERQIVNALAKLRREGFIEQTFSHRRRIMKANISFYDFDQKEQSANISLEEGNNCLLRRKKLPSQEDITPIYNNTIEKTKEKTIKKTNSISNILGEEESEKVKPLCTAEEYALFAEQYNLELKAEEFFSWMNEHGWIYPDGVKVVDWKNAAWYMAGHRERFV